MLDFIWESLSESFFTFGIPILIIILFYGAYEIYAYKKNTPEDDNKNILTSKTNEQRLVELDNIKRQIENGEEVQEIDAVTALYIARNWDDYNLYASEKGTIVFEKMKNLEDAINVPSSENNKLQNQNKTNPSKPKLEYLPDGTTRLINNLGWTQFDESGLIIATKVFADEAKKEEEEASKNKKNSSNKQNKKEEAAKANAILENENVSEKNEVSRHEETFKKEPAVNFKKLEDEMKSLNNFSTNNFEEEAEEIKVLEPKIKITETKTETISKIEDGQIVKKEIQVETINPKNLANAISGKEPKQKKQTIPEYYIMSDFENLNVFVRSIFLQEEKLMSVGVKNFLAFLSLHENVFWGEKDSRMFIHIDSLVLSVARTIRKEEQHSFLSALYNREGFFNNDMLTVFLTALANKFTLVFNGSFILFSSNTHGKITFMFSRGIKSSNKQYLGEFIIFHFKDGLESLITAIDKTSNNNAIVVATKNSEFNSFSGKRLKLRNIEEMKQCLI